MRILITGGAGFIGSHIADHYLEQGHEVASVDSLWTEGGGKEANLNSKVRFYQADITDETAISRIFDEFQPEIVNHHAAQHSVAISTKQPKLDAQVNVLGLLNILTQAKRVNAKKIIFASSGATYGTPMRLPLDEDTSQRPESPYGITKMVAEFYLRYWHTSQGLNFTILRYGNIYGPRQDPNGEAGVISIFAKRFLAHESVRIDWDGEQRKDYVYVGDVARANVQALKRGDNEIFCIGTGRAVSVNEIYKTLAQIIGFEAPITHAPRRPGDIYQAFFDSSKAERLLNWKPEVSFEDGVKATIDFFRH
ncbi:SDR family NAD(P)-dependent oxidoreductase [Dictyobacter arantiisoli]|uniref:UDP-glucose 4-epimerase n=1 Tax=Dictyobacter arantiisoli TaxID=2014874 RepID=A0A5A5TFZ5_9CHLR|nr:SDR family NAD(P)-dependent oxidoreductase [Dictyobacter arantiisoli]GCF10500.1 UDP-glucose 4-epimerase [Dictyobacter arantiisoli]